MAAEQLPAEALPEVDQLTRDPFTLAIGLIIARRSGLPMKQLGAITLQSLQELIADRSDGDRAKDLGRFALHLADLAARAIAEWELAIGDPAHVDAVLQEWGRSAAKIGR
ncbi:hypothetical protein [Nonomuraea rhizosphaerae]|uniref:hypothetical protein n=1 Tax=Nonomuraea rhizosphaerae TaxID=2665663 RepID=UPI001C5DEACC|nr:hypothetical protein [Nonomuraea rhizosphaerae]